MITETDETAIDVGGLAEMLNVSKDTAYNLIHAGDVPAFKVGRVWRMFPSQVREHLAAPVDPWQRSPHSRARRKVA
jgi:excisionase family DNA binding protein